MTAVDIERKGSRQDCFGFCRKPIFDDNLSLQS